MRHIIDAIAAQGRGDDKELLHVTKGELAGLDALARRHFGRELPRNPRTGIKEASLFRDWFGNDVGMAADIAVPTLAGAALTATGAGAPVGAALLGAGIGAANQGLGQGGTTESAIMGGIAGGMGAYGGANLAQGAAEAGTSQIAEKTLAAAPETGMPIANAGQTLSTGGADIATAGQSLPTANAAGETLIQSPDKFSGLSQSQYSGTVQSGLDKGLSNAQINANLTGQNAPTMTKLSEGASYLGTKDAISPALTTATGGAMAASIPGGTSDTTGTGITTTTNKNLPKAEVYYTPTGERRTRIVGAASGGLMGFADYDAADADAQGGYAPGGLAQYAGGGIATIRQLQPGGEMGGATADIYGAVQEHKPEWLQNIEPGGFMGAMVPGKMDWEDKQRAEEDERKRKEQEAAAQAKLQQEQQARNQIRAAQGGLMSMAKGRYLQGPGDGMSDSIHANIDGKQEARLATGEFVVPADVVSHLGNGDSTAGAKQLHSMMDRARMSRTGTKKQGKQINPRKVMPV